MPRLKNKTPVICRHSNGRDAILYLSGKVHYLGRFGSAAARQEGDRLVAQWLANGRQFPEVHSGMTINQLVLGFLRHCDEYYRKNGKRTREYGIIKEAVEVVLELFGDAPVVEFGPLRLKCVRERMIKRAWSRRYINKQIGRVIRCFRWGVENELVPETIYRSLRTVPGLKKGRTQAPDYEPVGPVAQAIVSATIANSRTWLRTWFDSRCIPVVARKRSVLSTATKSIPQVTCGCFNRGRTRRRISESFAGS